MCDSTICYTLQESSSILLDTLTRSKGLEIQYDDSVSQKTDTTCATVDNNDKGCEQWINEAVPLLTLLMLLIMVIQLYKQIRDSRETSKKYKEYLDKQKENVDIIVKSVQKNGLIKSIIYKNMLRKNYEKLCHYLTNDMNITQGIEQDYVRRVVTSLDILYNLMKYYKINNKDVDGRIQSFNDDLQKLMNNEYPHTIQGVKKWLDGFMEKNSPVVKEVCELFDKDTPSN